MAIYRYICGYDFDSIGFGSFMKDIFTPEDFDFYDDNICKVQAERANRILKERLLDGAVRVYNRGKEKLWTTYTGSETALTALLIDIQPIEKVCPLHIPLFTGEFMWDPNKLKCGNCGKKLVAEWRAE